MLDRLALTGLLLIGYSAFGSDIKLEPAGQNQTYTLNQTIVSARYTMPSAAQITGYEVRIKPLPDTTTPALFWSITGNTSQGGYISVDDFQTANAPTDADGFKLFTLGLPYASTAGSFESLTLGATNPNAWQFRGAVTNGSFELKPTGSPQPVPEASTATLGAIGLIASVIAFVFRRYQNAH